jgi:hypothetical protein
MSIITENPLDFHNYKNCKAIFGNFHIYKIFYFISLKLVILKRGVIWVF